MDSCIKLRTFAPKQVEIVKWKVHFLDAHTIINYMGQN